MVLDHVARQGATERLELVLVDRGVTARAADKLGRRHSMEVRRVGWDDKQPVFGLSGPPGATAGPARG